MTRCRLSSENRYGAATHRRAVDEFIDSELNRETTTRHAGAWTHPFLSRMRRIANH
jgi:hypothetical protein